MATAPSKSSLDRKTQDFEGLLSNLQNWELSFDDKDKKLKLDPIGMEKLDPPVQTSRTNNSGLQSDSTRNGKRSGDKIPSENTGYFMQYDYLKGYDTLDHFSSGFPSNKSSIDASSEKELGNDYFKKGKYNEAIDCYSRSIALSPTAVTYANRAMAYIKIKRFQEAENDCSEALNLDDRYIKAYSRRSTARKELSKIKESLDDVEFALRLEPENQEIKKQYAEAKSLFQKEILKKASGVVTGFKSKAEKNPSVQKLGSASTRSPTGIVAEIREIGASVIRDNHKSNVPMDKVEEFKGSKMKNNVSDTSFEIVKKKQKNGKQEVSVQELATRATSFTKAEAAKSIVPPNSAYEFEVSWRGLSGDRDLQARLLKVTSPTALPGIFKNALSAPILFDVVKCIATFFMEDMALAVDYLLNLTKIPRFDMIIMCLSSTYRADLVKIWDDIFCKGDPDYSNILDNLRSRYGIQQ